MVFCSIGKICFRRRDTFEESARQRLKKRLNKNMMMILLRSYFEENWIRPGTPTDEVNEWRKLSICERLCGSMLT